jgi:exonuclease III
MQNNENGFPEVTKGPGNFRIVTWNMDHWKRSKEKRAFAWEYLLKNLNPDIALLQEARAPDEIIDRFHTITHPLTHKKRWGNVLVSKHQIRQEIHMHNYYYGSRSLIVAEIRVNPKIVLTAICVYGAIDGRRYASTTMHHVLSDITYLLWQKRRGIVLGGDLNVDIQWDQEHPGDWPAHEIVFERMRNLGLIDCTNGPVRTQVQENSDIPWQNDYIFVNKRLKGSVLTCKVIEDPSLLELSNHYPIVLDLDGNFPKQ